MLFNGPGEPVLQEKYKTTLARIDESAVQKPIQINQHKAHKTVSNSNVNRRFSHAINNDTFTRRPVLTGRFCLAPVSAPDDPVIDIGDQSRRFLQPQQNFNATSTTVVDARCKVENAKSKSFPSSFVSLACYGCEPRLPGPLLKLNISGTQFIVKMNTLRSDQMVYEKIMEDAEWLADTDEYYLERDPVVFRYVHSYLRYKELHLPQNMCGPLLEKELEAWGLQLGFDLQRCCLGPVMESKSKLESLHKFEREFTEANTRKTICCAGSQKWQEIREDVWRVIGDTPKKRWLNQKIGTHPTIPEDEDVIGIDQTIGASGNLTLDYQISADTKTHDTTARQVNLALHKQTSVLPDRLIAEEEPRPLENGASVKEALGNLNNAQNWRQMYEMPKRIIFSRVYNSLQAIVICSLIVLMTLGYLPSLRIAFGPQLRDNSSLIPPSFPFHVNRMYFAFDESQQRLTRPFDVIVYLQWVCVVLFTLDLIARALFCPNILRWLRSIYTITDVISLTPFYVEGSMYITINAFPNTAENADKMVDMLQVLDIVNLMKIFVVGRLFRILQRQRATRVLLYTVRTSAGNMLMLLELMILCAVFFGTAIFFLDSRFENIFWGIWWAFITMATVGYGDIAPSSIPGYVLAIFCVIVGILLTSYTVPILVNDFLLYYSHADQLAWMRRVHTSATEKRRSERRDMMAKRRINRVRALLKNTVIGTNSVQRTVQSST